MIVLPPVPAGEPVRVSATTYIRFHECPDQGLGRFRGHYPGDSRSSLRGGLVHELIAQHLVAGAHTDPHLTARMILGSDEFKNKIGPSGLGRPSLLYPVIDEAVDLYLKFSRLPHDGFEHAEVELEYEPAEGVTVLGKIDAVFSGPLLRDWKTGPLIEPLQQLLFYALVWMWRHGGIPLVEAISIQTGEAMNSRPTMEQLATVAEELAEIVKMARSGAEQAERRAGPWCRFCPLLEGCPEGQTARSINF